MESFRYQKAAGVTALAASIADFAYTRHSHGDYALGVTLRGIQQFSLDGIMLRSGPGGILLFQPEQVHDGKAQEKSGLDYQMIYIPPALFAAVSGRKDIVRFAAPVVYTHHLRHSILSLIRAVFSGADDAVCSELLFSLVHNVSGDAHDRPSDTIPTPVRRTREMIMDTLGSGHSLQLDTICRELRIPKYTLIRLFKATTGMSPYQFYLSRKVEKAKQIIEARGDIYQAVAECGFVDLSHFNRHFKSRYGVTAYEYLSGIC